MRGRNGRREAFACVAMGCLVAGCIGMARAQAPLPAPDLDLVGNGRVLAMAREADGGLILGGDFQTINGIPRRYLARIQPDGTLDATWHPSPDNWVTALAASPDGDIFVGGYFTNIDGIPRQSIAKLDRLTGIVESTWSHDNRADIRAIAVDANGDVFAASASATPGIFKLSGIDGGELWISYWEHADFLVLDGHGSLYSATARFDLHEPWPTYRPTIAKRSSATGELDASWSPALTGAFDDNLYALATDGMALYAGGSFGLRKFLASTGADAPGWNAPAANITAIAIRSDGHVYVGGSFKSIHGQVHRNIATLSGNSGLPLPWWNTAANDNVGLMNTDDSDGVDIAGRFQSIDETQRIGYAHIEADGEMSVARNDIEAPAKAFALAAQRDGGMIVAGAFHRAGSSPHRNILRLDADGTLDDTWNPALPSMPWVLAADAEGTVYAAMNHWSNEQIDSNVARIDPLGHVDRSWSLVADQSVNAMAVGADGDLLVGGEFSTIGGAARRALAKIDAKSSVPLPGWDARIDCCSVNAIGIGEGDDLFVGGSFASVDGSQRDGLAKLSTQTASVDSQWAPATGGASINAIALDHAGSLYAAGNLGSINGEQHPLVAKLRAEGSGEPAAMWYANFCWGMNGRYYDIARLALDEHGTVYAVGFFCVDPLSNEYGLVRLSGENGLIDEDWRPLAWYDAPYDIAVSTTGSIYVVGNFEQAGSLPRSGLAAFAPTVPDRLFMDGFEDRRW